MFSGNNEYPSEALASCYEDTLRVADQGSADAVFDGSNNNIWSDLGILSWSVAKFKNNYEEISDV